MSPNVVAERDFTDADQQRFAAISGDRNPIHMDAVAVRRTVAGFPVVHGAHVVLWGLDSLFGHIPDLPPIASIQASFEKMIYVGDRVEALLTRRDGQRLRVEVIVDGTRAVRLEVNLGAPRSSSDVDSSGPLLQPAEPLVLTYEQMIRCYGRIPFFSSPMAVCKMFPAAAEALGSHRVAALACSSFLVGMVCPGLHSIYRGLTLTATPIGEGANDMLHFRAVDSDPRFRLLKLAVSGGGWIGFLEAHARPEPRNQPDPTSIAASVVPGEFNDVSALVVGGSRGLGELIAKIVAVGGGHVTLTFSAGEADARRVQAEIRREGGSCEVVHYDIRANASDQISHLLLCPTQVYYMPTPVIYRRLSAVFSQTRLEEFLSFYVTAFYDLYRGLKSKFDKEITFFYPSSVYVDARPDGMTEYAMAKAAGEILCADLQSRERPGRILLRRLPRLPTDQTVSIFSAETADPISVILPIVREVSANRADR